jgi:hypothetical protein
MADRADKSKREEDERITGAGNENVRGIADDEDDDFEDTEDLDEEEDEESTTF